MFTGIITHEGTFSGVEKSTFSFVAPQSLITKLKIGSSICVNGVCLTVIEKSAKGFEVDVMPETLKRTNLGMLKKGAAVNLERAMGVNGLFEGHILQGHVDGFARVKSIRIDKNSHLFDFEAGQDLTKFMVEKGSVAVNGVSLTLIWVKRGGFGVGIIPFTLENTNFGDLKAGDFVNVETDILAKYILYSKIKR